MSKLTVKDFNPAVHNVDMLVNIIHYNFLYLNHDPNLQHTKEEIKRLLTDKNCIGFLVFDGKKLVAYMFGELKFLNDGRNVYYISYVYVIQSYRNRKIGSYLMNLAIQKMKQRNIRYIVLTVDIQDKKAYDFYMKKGFMPDNILRNYGRHEVLSMQI